MKLYQNKIINTTYFYIKLLVSFLATNFLLLGYLLLLTLSTKVELSLVILFLVSWPIHPFIITFFEMINRDEADVDNMFHEMKVNIFLKQFYFNIKTYVAWLIIDHLILFVLVVDALYLSLPIKAVFLILLFIALSITLIGHYLLSVKQLSLKQVFKQSIEVLYTNFFKNLSYLFCYLVLLLAILWYVGPLLSLFVFFIFLTLVKQYFDKIVRI